MNIDIEKRNNKLSVGDVVHSNYYNSLGVIGEDRDGDYILISLPDFRVMAVSVFIESLVSETELELVCLHEDLVLTTK